MARPKKESKVMDEIEQLHDLVDALTEDVDRIFSDIYLNPLEKPKKTDTNICGIPEEVFEYMEKHCDSMFMGMS